MNYELRITNYALRQVLILGLYLALTLALTYPLVAQFGDHVPGTATWSLDEYTLLWNNWWFKHAIFDLGVNPLHTDFLYYPIGTSLVFYMYTLLHVIIGLPIQFAFGIPAASNSEVVFAFVVTGYGAYLLIRYLLREHFSEWRDAAAFVGGAVFAFSSNRFVYASLGHYNMVGMEWVPLFVLFFIKTIHETRIKNALLAGLFLALALYLEMTYGVLLFLFALVYLSFVWRVVFTRATITRLSTLSATAIILFLPLLIPTLGEIFSSGYTFPGWGSSDKLLVDLFGFFAPTSLHPLNRFWVEELDQVRQGIARFSDVNTVFLGYVTSALALLAAIRFWKTLRAWAISASTFAILSMGPLLHINGTSRFDLDGLQVTFPLPFLILHYLPIIKENRTPNRFGVLVMLALAVLVAFAIAWILARLSRFTIYVSRFARITVYGSLLTALLFEHAALPLPLTDARVPDLYAQIAREPGDFTVLTLPLGWRNSFGQQGSEDTRVQYYQSVHRKRIFPGNINRNPPFQFEYFDRIPVFHSITEIEFYRAANDLARDKLIAPALMTFFDIRYVVINPAVPGRVPYSDTRAAVIEYVQNVLPLGEKIFDRDGTIAYRVNQARLPARQKIAFGTESARPYQGEGWDRDEMIADAPAQWANRRDARAMFPLREIADYEITLRALPFDSAQTLELIVNDLPIQKFEMQLGWDDYRVTVPARFLKLGINHLVLQFSNVARPRDVLPANFAIGKTGITSPVEIVVNAGETGSIKIGGKEASPQKRGYNVVVIDPANGAIISARAFDTVNDRAESRAFTDFIAQIPNGHIVAIASQDAVAANLGDRAALAFRDLGGQIDLRQNPTRTHALIGVKSATPGSALEQSQDGATFIWVGKSQDTRTLAAAVSGIVIEKK
jgi:hypothetical protein